MAFRFTKLKLRGVILIESDLFRDARGSLVEVHNNKVFRKNGINAEFVQDLVAVSKKNVLRGLHYQLKPNAQAKLVSVISGRIFDVCVDMRRSSKTYSKWIGVELSEANRRMLMVPEGFAHGYLALEDSRVMYKIAGEYSKPDSRGVAWNDPELGIRWPATGPIIASDTDRAWPGLKDADNNFH